MSDHYRTEFNDPWQIVPDDPRINDSTYWAKDDETEVKELLTKVDKGYIGLTKPKVQIVKDLPEDGWYDRDNDARSPLEADLEDIR